MLMHLIKPLMEREQRPNCSPQRVFNNLPMILIELQMQPEIRRRMNG